jgi:hypothetical protein
MNEQHLLRAQTNVAATASISIDQNRFLFRSASNRSTTTATTDNSAIFDERVMDVPIPLFAPSEFIAERTIANRVGLFTKGREKRLTIFA